MRNTIILYGVLIAGVVLFSFWLKGGIEFSSYQYLYLGLAVFIWIASYRYFGGRFIRPQWKKLGKFLAYMTISFGLLIWVKHSALIFIVGHQLLGGVGHIMICKKNGIDWLTCQPEEKYIALTEKWAKGDFSKPNT